MPIELFGNLILIKQIGKNYVNYKALTELLFTHTHKYIYILYTTLISPIFWLKDDSISNEYLILSCHLFVCLKTMYLIQISKMNEGLKV